MILSIFNNGSQAWVLLVFMIVWGVVFGRKVYNHFKAAKQAGVKYSPTKDSDAKLLLFGELGLLVFLLWINSEYA